MPPADPHTLFALTTLLGTAIGLIMALTGAGGGILAVPLLVVVLHLPLVAAAPAAMAAVALSATLGAVLGLREGIVRYRAAAFIGIIGMLAAPLGVTLAGRLPNAPLLVAFASLLLLVAWRNWQPPEDEAEPPKQACRVSPTSGRIDWTAPCARALAGTGLLAGLASGLLGVGGGFIIVPALARHTDLPRRSIVATSLAIMALVALGGLVAVAAHGRLSGDLTLPFSAGAIVGLLGGRRLLRRLPEHGLRRAFAFTCVMAAGLVLSRLMH